MRKDKNGKVTASLTEVKNKTGDIFDLVDEFGEVILTSYNKPRYKITKIGIAEILENDEPKIVKASETEEEKPITQKVKEIFTREVIKEEVREEKAVGLISDEVLEQTKTIKWWDVKNSSEESYTKSIRKPLV
jgi:hypothetical protein